MIIRSAVSWISAVALLLVCPNAMSDDGLRNGRWWVKQSEERQAGYVAGFADCGIYDAGLAAFAHASAAKLQSLVLEDFRAQPQRATRSVPRVLIELAPKARVAPRSGGEEYNEKHGYFDGEYWRKSEPDHQRGFIDGYLDCWRFTGQRSAKYSRPTEEYKTRVTEWYREGGESHFNNLDRTFLKIADVLRRFAD